MMPLEIPGFGTDPWWISLIKAACVLVYLLLFTLFNIVYERKVVAYMQHRKGPTMNGPGGWGQSLADGVKLMVKEDFRPKLAERFVYNLAPYLVAIPAFSILAVIPFGGEVTMFGVRTRLQLADTPVSVLLILALASVGIYGIVLAGWSSGSTYALLGGLRSSAQMISYEIAMGLSFVAVFLYAGTMSTSQIVEVQNRNLAPPLLGEIPLPGHFWILLLPSFLIYLISMVGETNRAPFDLPECEGELVGGFHTEYSGFRFAMFFLAEYINMVNVSAVAATLFLGGWRPPWFIHWIPGADNPWLGPVWLTVKIIVFMFLFIWLRGTLPRLRYDQFMNLGWKWLIPISIFWIIAVATLRSLYNTGFSIPVLIGIGLVVAALLAVVFLTGSSEDDKVKQSPAAEFDPYAGGYPVPPMGDQRLPEMAGVVEGEAEHSDRFGAAHPDPNGRADAAGGANSRANTEADS